MRKTQILKVNHHLKNGVTIAEDTDTVLLNADINRKTIKINHKSTKNQINHSINTWKKIEIYQTKTFIVTIALENHYQIAQIIQEINHLITLTTEVDHQIKEIHESPHKIDIVDHTVEVPFYRSNYSRPNSNRQNYSFDTNFYSHPRNRHHSIDRSRNSSHNRHRNYPNNRNRSFSNNRNQQ